MTSRFRLSARSVALSYCALGIAVLAIFALPLWYAWNETIEAGRTSALNADTLRMAEVLDSEGAPALAAAIRSRMTLQRAGGDEFILLADAGLHTLAGNLNAWPGEIGVADGRRTRWIEQGGRRIRLTYVTSTLPGGYHLLVGNDLGKFRALEFSFFIGLGAATLIVLLLGMAGGLLLRRHLLGQVEEIRQATAAIMAGKLSHRLPDIGGESELNKLVAMQNSMLDQIEHLVKGVLGVSDAIAHDLRTPLSIVRARLEYLRALPGGAEDMDAGIDMAIADLDHVIGIFNALLRLAEIDAGARRSGFIRVDIADIVGEVAEQYQMLAEAQGGTLSLLARGPFILEGDPVLLAQAIANLLDNALKYNRPQGHISVDVLKKNDGSIIVVVGDEGPGIPDIDKEKVLQRFFRRDASRNTAGVGLGLSVVASIARLHGGDITFSDRSRGLDAILRLRARHGD